MKIFVATPFYHAENCLPYTVTIARVLPQLARLTGHTFHWVPCVGDATHRQRNGLAAHFLATDCDETWLIDCDQSFDAENGRKFLAVDADVVLANYPQRSYQWANALGRVFTTVDELKAALCVGTVAAQRVNGETIYTHGGCGMMKIRRRVFESLIQRNLVDQITADKRMPPEIARWHYRFFEFPLIDGEDRGEDWWFCDLARACGHTLGCDPTVRVAHHGLESYDGLPEINFQTVAENPTPQEKSHDQAR